MTHARCGGVIRWREEPLPAVADEQLLLPAADGLPLGPAVLAAATLRLLVPICEACGIDVPEDEIT